MGRRRSDDRGVEIEVFATGDTRAVVPVRRSVEAHDSHDIDDVHPDLTTRAIHNRAAIRDWIDRADMHAHPGPRIGTTTVPTTSSRLGDGADIVRPVLIDPHWASELATSGALFAEQVEHLEIDTGTEADRQYLVWNARLDIGTRRPFQASLHLLASASMLVTVLELVPQRRTRRHRDRFVSAGVLAIDELAERLQQATSTATSSGVVTGSRSARAVRG
jgi:hypothetical protein